MIHLAGNFLICETRAPPAFNSSQAETAVYNIKPNIEPWACNTSRGQKVGHVVPSWTRWPFTSQVRKENILLSRADQQAGQRSAETPRLCSLYCKPASVQLPVHLCRSLSYKIDAVWCYVIPNTCSEKGLYWLWDKRNYCLVISW